jgi:hypothetical protein
MSYTWPMSSFLVVLVVFGGFAIVAVTRPAGAREGFFVRAAFASVLLGIPLGYPIARFWMTHTHAPPSEVFWSEGPGAVVWVVDEMDTGDEAGDEKHPRITIVDLDSGKAVLVNGSFDEPNLLGRTSELFWVEDYTDVYAAYEARTGRMKIDLAKLQASDPRLASLAKEALAGFDEKTHSIRLQAADGTIYAVDASFQVTKADGAGDPGLAACSWREEPGLRFVRAPDLTARDGSSLSIEEKGPLTVARRDQPSSSADSFLEGKVVVDDARCHALLLDGPESALVVSSQSLAPGGNGRLTRVSLADGSTVWKQDLDVPRDGLLSATVVGGDIALVQRHGRGWMLRRLAPDGAERWRFED